MTAAAGTIQKIKGMFISIELRFLEFVESVINTNIIIYPDTVLSRTGRYTAQKIPAQALPPPGQREAGEQGPAASGFRVIPEGNPYRPQTGGAPAPCVQRHPAASPRPAATKNGKERSLRNDSNLRPFPFMRLRRSADHRTATSRSCRRGYSPTALRGRPAS